MSSYRERMRELFLSQEGADTTILVGDVEFKVHRLLLATQSPVFKRMFDTDMKEKRESTLEIADMDPEVVEAMLIFIYTGSNERKSLRFAFDEDQCKRVLSSLPARLLYAACKYELPSLKAICEEELKIFIFPSTIPSILKLNELYSTKELMDEFTTEAAEWLRHHNYKSSGNVWTDLINGNTEAQLLYTIMSKMCKPRRHNDSSF